MANMKLSVITITYNNERIIKKYLDSIGKNLPFGSEIIIVDNNSTDNTAKFIKAQKEIEFIQNDQNLGFSKANNLAVKSAKGEYLLFLNPDTEVLDDAVDKLLDFIQSHENVGIVAPKLVEPSGQAQPSVRELPSIWGAIKEYFLGIKNSYEAYVPAGLESTEVESVVGGAILIKRELFESLGKFNEKYFLYYEDLELCKKVREGGFKIFYLPQAQILHEVGGSWSDQKSKLLVDSAKRYHGKLGFFVLNLILHSRRIFSGI